VDDCKRGQQPEKGKFCPFNYKDLFQDRNDRCSSSNNYGYDLGTPCILVKLNRIYGWVPKPYTKEEAAKETKIPPKIKAAIEKASGPKDEGVYISCEGENPADKENIGELSYAPSQLIHKTYFPYTNQPGYLSPFVMVQFKQPARGVLINVECKAWASNIRHERQDREGSVHFELLID
jgi:sodium/potassium-transporting ATPase subunit beta